MPEAATLGPHKAALVSKVPRRSMNVTHKVTPSFNEPKPNFDSKIIHSTPLDPSTHAVEEKSPDAYTMSVSKANDKKEGSQLRTGSALPMDKCLSPSTDKPENPLQNGKSCRSVVTWFREIRENDTAASCLSKEQKVLVKVFVPLALIAIVLVAVLVPVLILTASKPKIESSFTNTTASTCAATCIGQETPYRTSMVTVLYPFDGNANDLSGYATGILLGITTPGYSGNCYVGSQSLSFGAIAQQQYVQIPSLALTQTSFTIQTWLYLGGGAVIGDLGIFGQCDLSNICLTLSLRNGRFVLSFDSMNTDNNTLIGTSIFPSQTWTHVTVVYDAVLFQQQIYVNGLIDAVSRGMVAAYRGTTAGAITTIGRTLSFAYSSSYFPGHIDHFSVSVGSTRSSCQILNDATLTAYYPFDTVATFNDYSVNLFNGFAGSLTTIANGPVDQAIKFSASTSFFQAECFPEISNAEPPFTFALWINPATTTGGGSLIHVSSQQNGAGANCYDLLAFTSAGALVVQIMQSTTAVTAYQGPLIPANTWTHVTVVFGSSNGVRIYVNGQLGAYSQTTSSIVTINVGSPQFVTLGNNSPQGLSGSVSCTSGTIPIVPGPFVGGMDDFRLYNRELDNQEICTLANM